MRPAGRAAELLRRQAMQMTPIILVGLVVLVLIVFLIRKNSKDKALLNPDAPDVVEEAHHDQQEEKKHEGP